MRKLLTLILILLISSTAACDLAAPVVQVSIAPVEIGYRLVTSDPRSTATPTPFQPLPITPTFIPTVATRTPLPTIAPTTTPLPPTNTPPPLPDSSSREQINQPKGQVNIMILGSDSRGTADFRTDVIILVSLDMAHGTVSLLSFPRDLYVYIPGWYNNRINVAMEFGGFKTFQATMQQNFGFKPDHYVMTSFNGFKDAVNSLNGISVNASKKLTDRCDLRIQKRGICSVGPGPVTMDGDMALWYVRSRYSTSDFDRTRRAQEVIQAMFFRLMKKDAISRLPQLYKDFSSSIQTDMSLSDILPLAPFAQTITDPSKIRRFAVGPGEVYDWISPEGAMVLVPIQTNVMKVVRDTLNP